MGFMDKVKGMLGQRQDKVEKGVDKAAEKADTATKGKYSGQIKSGTEKAKKTTEQYGRKGQSEEGGQGGGERGSGSS